MTPIRAVLFDYGLVLTGPPDPAAWRRMQDVLRAPDPAFHDAYWHHRHDYDLGVLGGQSYWLAVASDLDRSITELDLSALLDADIDLWTQPNQPMIDWARCLQNVGIPTGILSNIGDAMETGILKRCPWLGGFAHRTFSHRLGIAKPDQRIYTLAVDAMGRQPEETLFLDDRSENIVAARAVGLQTIHYTGHDEFLRALDQLDTTGIPHPSACANSDSCPKVERSKTNV